MEPHDTAAQEEPMQSILEYHARTAHARGLITGRPPNQANRPMPFKAYPDAPLVAPALRDDLPDIPLDHAQDPRDPVNPDLPALLLATCGLAAGISQVRTLANDTVFHFRAPPSAGALYPTELYLAVQNVNGLSDGLYHYSPLRHALSHLRSGPVFVAPEDMAGRPLARFIMTSIFFRSAWKYGPRAYRYCLLDAGHMAGNLLLAAGIHGLGGELDYDFDDATLTAMLDIDPLHEGGLAQVHCLDCTRTTAWAPPPPATIPDLPGFSRCAPRAETPPDILEAHRITSSFARCPMDRRPAPMDGGTPLAHDPLPVSTATAIMGRRSRRNFAPCPTRTRPLADLLGLLCRDRAPACTGAVHTGLLAAADSGLPPGRHALHRAHCATALLAPGAFLARSARVCLDQGWLENAAMHLAFTADLAGLERRCGPRAYRHAHMEAGRLGQLACLGASARRLGACPIGAFFDQEAATLLSLPAGHALLGLVAVGCVRTR
jgi:SagB-type dehydrogenase family enzyme